MNKSRDKDDIDWSRTTFEGAERENLRGWRRLSFDEKLRANEEMNNFANEIFARRKARGEPYFDPDTGEFVPGRKGADASQVAESPADYPPTCPSRSNTHGEE